MGILKILIEMNLLRKQYLWVKESRNVVLNFLSQLPLTDFTTPIPSFNEKNLCFISVHIFNVYQHWIGKFALNQEIIYKEEKEITTVAELIQLFKETDLLMDDFFNRYENDEVFSISGEIAGKKLNFTTLQVFTHVITHEFHHKGQLMSICRLLGHIPPDADLIRT